MPCGSFVSARTEVRGGGSWNAPVDSTSNEFAYVAIPEPRAIHAGMEKPYSALAPALSRFGVALPGHLRARHMHLDPDFDYLSYGDQGDRARQLRTKLSSGDRLVFYSGMKDVHDSRRLVYAIIGIFVVDDIVLATSVPESARNANAHSRRILAEGAAAISSSRADLNAASPSGNGGIAPTGCGSTFSKRGAACP